MKEDIEGAEEGEKEVAEIALYETKQETSDKKRDNFNCVFHQTNCIPKKTCLNVWCWED